MRAGTGSRYLQTHPVLCDTQPLAFLWRGTWGAAAPKPPCQGFPGLKALSSQDLGKVHVEIWFPSSLYFRKALPAGVRLGGVNLESQTHERSAEILLSWPDPLQTTCWCFHPARGWELWGFYLTSRWQSRDSCPEAAAIQDSSAVIRLDQCWSGRELSEGSVPALPWEDSHSEPGAAGCCSQTSPGSWCWPAMGWGHSMALDPSCECLKITSKPWFQSNTTLCKVSFQQQSWDLPSARTRAGLASAGASTLWQRPRAGNSILLIFLPAHIPGVFQGEDSLY